MKYLIIILVFFSLSTAITACHAETKFLSQLGHNCDDICQLHNTTCEGITTNDFFYNASYCFIDYDVGGDEFCSNAVGNCQTVLNDDGYQGCLNASSTPDCFKYPDIQAQWTRCICKDVIATSTPVSTTTYTLDIGKEYFLDKENNVVSVVKKPFNLFLFVAITFFFSGFAYLILILSKKR